MNEEMQENQDLQDLQENPDTEKKSAIKVNKKFTSEEVASFCDQIAMLMNSGIPLYEGAYILADEVEDKRTKQILGRIEEMVRDNYMLYEALEDTGAFPDYMVHMVKVGEMTGKTEEVLRSLATYYERDASVKAGIKSAVTFPIVLFGMMAAIMLVMVFKIIPLFEGMFLELNEDVADSTRTMMNVGVATGKVLTLITCVLLVLLIAGIFWYKTPKGEATLKKFVGVFRPTRKLAETMATGQFISSLGLMTASGMDQNESLELAREGCSNDKIKARIEECRVLCSEGENFDDALGKSKVLVGRENRMVAVALRTGATDTVLEKLGNQYDEKIGRSLTSMSGKIETAMVIILAVMVATVLISIMLPLVSMISSIG